MVNNVDYETILHNASRLNTPFPSEKEKILTLLHLYSLLAKFRQRTNVPTHRPTFYSIVLFQARFLKLYSLKATFFTLS